MDFTELKEFLDHLTSWRIPGNGVKVCLEGKEVFSYTSGYADVENKIPMTLDHYVNIYSCSKVATVTAALQLYEQGKFLLDDPLYAFIPEYKEMYIAGENGPVKAENPITLRHLFTMTSGLTYNRKTQAFEKARELTGGKMDTLTVIRCLASDPLAFEPGERWNYSLSHDVLAAVVEVASGKRFSEYVRENIFAPLDAKVVYNNESVRDKMAVQYEYIDGKAVSHIAQQAGKAAGGDGYYKPVGPVIVGDVGPEYESGGGGIATTINDYSKFCVALANDGVGATGERILRPETIELLRTNQLNADQLKPFNWPQLRGYGYGLGVRTLLTKDPAIQDPPIIGNLGEFGWGGAAGATVLIDPEYKLSVFYAHHMLNPQEDYYQPRLRNVVYSCIL